ncbi:Predicted metal-dependent hydrolase, TIM-barrel fold [Tistlia consotensis]|uniref:Predicted metal-dependent hydrolase, TIM-barrel fold n=1 Tax=Tistlia consotensis USBA 355 TaxID=560819 RepID=A0A1Y6BA45_9PROT|nr:amidohydrolase family protein [Tistlia consotensis]SME93708.1 Predicted metal-dependent hydrolase, TIM-barrel fold [Tistlia consotensis USBA 355]SNR28758.1 Predicted metal-dependent hydrolase, TIM-barrel fold [Tistlia consotensis]
MELTGKVTSERAGEGGEATAEPLDAHAHVFDLSGPLASGRRYTPRRPAPVADYLALLDAVGIGRALLVQPSFLGSDNRFLLRALAALPARFRGVAVVEPDCPEPALAELRARGVVGLRLNILERPAELGLTAAEVGLARRAAGLGLHLELHCRGGALPRLLDRLERAGVDRLVVDHYGRPDPARGLADPGFRRLLDSGPAGPAWVKLSGPYRCGGVPTEPYLDALAERLGPGRLVWGSDWPWTQHEDGRDFARLRDGPARRLGAAAMAAVDATAGRLWSGTI